MGYGLLTVKTLQSHSDTPHFAGVLWTSDEPKQRPVPDNTQLKGERHPCPWCDSDPQSQCASGHRLSLSPCRYLDRLYNYIYIFIIISRSYFSLYGKTVSHLFMIMTCSTFWFSPKNDLLSVNKFSSILFSCGCKCRSFYMQELKFK